MKKIIILFCILILGISISIFPLSKASASNLQSQVTCTINLVANTQNCNGIPNLTFVVPPAGGKTVVKLNMNPDQYYHVRFEVTYNSSTPTGWSVNIGDSATNDGWGGDAGAQSRDAELQVLGTTLSVFGSDLNSPPGGLLASFNNVTAVSYPLILEIHSEYLSWNLYYNHGEVISPCQEGDYVCALFALGDTSKQIESEGPVNDDLYAAFNRVINGDYRSGNNVTQVKITVYYYSTLKSGPVLMDR